MNEFAGLVPFGELIYNCKNICMTNRVFAGKHWTARSPYQAVQNQDLRRDRFGRFGQLRVKRVLLDQHRAPRRPSLYLRFTLSPASLICQIASVRFRSRVHIRHTIRALQMMRQFQISHMSIPVIPASLLRAAAVRCVALVR